MIGTLIERISTDFIIEYGKSSYLYLTIMRIFVLLILCIWYSSVNGQLKKVASDSSFVCYFPCNFTIPAKYLGGFKGWAKYIRMNINSELGNKYIDIPKNKKSAQVTVRISFMISKWGYVTDVERATNDTIKVHPKLVAEAIRVIKASPRWIAARTNSIRVAYRNNQAITWQVDKE